MASIEKSQARISYELFAGKFPRIARVLSTIFSVIGWFVNGHVFVFLAEWLIMTCGRIASSVLLFAALWVTGDYVAGQFFLDHLGATMVDTLSSLALISFSLLPEVILFSAIETSYKHWRSVYRCYKLTPSWRNATVIAAAVWSCLYTAPTIAFFTMAVTTFIQFASKHGHVDQATGLMLSIRALSGWFYALVGLVYRAIGTSEIVSSVNDASVIEKATPVSETVNDKSVNAVNTPNVEPVVETVVDTVNVVNDESVNDIVSVNDGTVNKKDTPNDDSVNIVNDESVYSVNNQNVDSVNTPEPDNDEPVSDVNRPDADAVNRPVNAVEFTPRKSHKKQTLTSKKSVKNTDDKALETAIRALLKDDETMSARTLGKAAGCSHTKANEIKNSILNTPNKKDTPDVKPVVDTVVDTVNVVNDEPVDETVNDIVSVNDETVNEKDTPEDDSVIIVNSPEDESVIDTGDLDEITMPIIPETDVNTDVNTDLFDVLFQSDKERNTGELDAVNNN